MSILQMSRIWTMRMEPLEKLVALTIADFADDEGKAWPSLATIARKSSLSESSVRRHLRKLESAGILQVIPRKDKTGRDTSSLIKIAGEGVNLLPLQPDRLGCLPDGVEGVCQTPSLSLNHQYEPSRENTRVLFGQFYTSYPKRKNRAAAEKAFNKLNPSVRLFTQMMDALAWQVKQPEWLKNGGQFIPLPASWLNARRWEDEKPPTTAVAPATPPNEGTTADYLRQAGLIA